VSPIDRLYRRIRRLRRLAAELQTLAVDVTHELSVFRRVLADDASGRLNVALEYALLRAAEADRREARRMAASGAWKIETKTQRNGAVLVRIDEGEWFRLSRGDARLLGILRNALAAEDGFPGWLTYDEVGEKIFQKVGTRPTRRALIESVYRIRKALKGADLNEYLLQVDRKGGRVRFLFRARPGQL
jgi:hypothetical protein